MRWYESLSLPIYVLALVALAFAPQQGDFSTIITTYTAAFVGYIVLMRSSLSMRHLILIGVLIRMILIFSAPNLSDDIYRFIWDGRMMHLGMNPYQHLPSDIVGTDPLLSQSLYDLLNSPNYYTIYPPVAQIINYISTYVPSSTLQTEILIYKAILFISELALLRVLISMSSSFMHHRRDILLYYLNPLIIIEIMGNCHHEGLMILFLGVMLLMMSKSKDIRAGMAYGLSIMSKALPLLFGPLLLVSTLRKRISWQMLIAGGITSSILVLPILISLQQSAGISDSVDLYIKSFEFNGSIYYLLRSIGYSIFGFNLIHVLGPALSVITILLILYISYRHDTDSINGIANAMLLIFMIFLLLSRTVHPWYVCVPIFLGAITGYLYPIIWSYVIFWTYANYGYAEYHENLIIVTMEYLILAIVMYWELIKKKPLISYLRKAA